MSETNLDDTIITALGGAKKVSDIIQDKYDNQCVPQGVSGWKRRGIPWRYRFFLADKAVREQGIKVPKSYLVG